MRQRSPRNPARSEKYRLELSSDLILPDVLRDLKKAVSCVVDENIYLIAFSLQRIDDIGVSGVVKIQLRPPPALGLDLLDELWCLVWVAGGGDYPVPVGLGLSCDGQAEA